MSAEFDPLISQYTAELEQKESFQRGLKDAAAARGGDMTDEEFQLFNDAGERIKKLNRMLVPLVESVKITQESRNRFAELQGAYASLHGERPTPRVEYRSAGHWIQDYWLASRGNEEAEQRIAMTRAAAHQTTTDNPGLLPEKVVAPVVNRVDRARPIVNMLNPTDPGDGSWAYAKVTQQAAVAKQSAEKAELTSQKMLVTMTAIAPDTFGGYVNVSAQNIRRSSPSIIDMVIDSLAGQYAIATENEAADDLYAGATAGTNAAVVAGTSTADEVTTARWVVASQVFTAMKGDGSMFLAISPDLLSTFGPLFGPAVQIEGAAPSSGFTIGGFGSGPIGQISGLPVVMSAGMNANRAMIVNTAAVIVNEHRYSALQVQEPSVLGVQVGYAGDFIVTITDTGGVVTVDTVA